MYTVPPAGRHYTVSIALPGSIIDNAQTHELKTYLAGQVRGCGILCSCHYDLICVEREREGVVWGNEKRELTIKARLVS